MRRAALGPLPFAVLLAFALASCKRPSREWRPEDHDEEPAGPTQVEAPPAGSATGNEALVETTWRSVCAGCHGLAGRGDGPNGPMVQAPNLADPALQDARTDEQLAAAIRQGKGKMPAFGQLPPSVVSGLVQLVRSLRKP